MMAKKSKERAGSMSVDVTGWFIQKSDEGYVEADFGCGLEYFKKIIKYE